MSSGKPSPRMVGTVDSRGTGRVHLVVDHTVFFFFEVKVGIWNGIGSCEVSSFLEKFFGTKDNKQSFREVDSWCTGGSTKAHLTVVFERSKSFGHGSCSKKKKKKSKRPGLSVSREHRNLLTSSPLDLVFTTNTTTTESQPTSTGSGQSRCWLRSGLGSGCESGYSSVSLSGFKPKSSVSGLTLPDTGNPICQTHYFWFHSGSVSTKKKLNLKNTHNRAPLKYRVSVDLKAILLA